MGLAYERSKEIYTEHIVRHSRSHDPAKGCVLPLLTHLRVLDFMFPRKDMARRKRLWVLSKAEWPWPQLALGLAVITQPGLSHLHAFTLTYCFSNTSLIRPASVGTAKTSPLRSLQNTVSFEWTKVSLSVMVKCFLCLIT